MLSYNLKLTLLNVLVSISPTVSLAPVFTVITEGVLSYIKELDAFSCVITSPILPFLSAYPLIVNCNLPLSPILSLINYITELLLDIILLLFLQEDIHPL